jgi:hypothetical protein
MSFWISLFLQVAVRSHVLYMSSYFAVLASSNSLLVKFRFRLYYPVPFLLTKHASDWLIGKIKRIWLVNDPLMVAVVEIKIWTLIIEMLRFDFHYRYISQA